jgi:Adenylate kinase/HD domain
LALKFLSCTIRETHPEFAAMILELWYEFEEGKTLTATIVQQIDKLECVQQAVMYEERTGKDMSDFMKLAEKITLHQLKPLKDTCLAKYQELQLRRKADDIIIFVSGGPGVGKGTQCDLLAKELNFSHISVGELLRKEMKDPNSPYTKFIAESMLKLVITPPQLTTLLLKREMDHARSQGKQKFLLDGFPRSLDQVIDFELKVHSTVR